jgi:hypothetical protein
VPFGITPSAPSQAALELGETSTTAYRGDRGKTAYDHSQAAGNPHGTTKSDVGLGNVTQTDDLYLSARTLSNPASTPTLTGASGTGHLVWLLDATNVERVGSLLPVLPAHWATHMTLSCGGRTPVLGRVMSCGAMTTWLSVTVTHWAL